MSINRETAICMLYAGYVLAPPLPDSSAPLQVKRLNWETHNPEQLDQTIWARRDSTDHLDIQDMVEYLELAQQFSTVKKKPREYSIFFFDLSSPSLD